MASSASTGTTTRNTPCRVCSRASALCSRHRTCFPGRSVENIRYGRLDASDSDVEQAAKVAGAHEFISSFEKGYAQDVGEGGNLLSVGQKQLISLARAVLAKPEIFIMDEATSSVDTLTEALIQRGMEALMQGRTSFIIAHRLSTIRRADRIVVIEAGSHRRDGHARRVTAPARPLLPPVHPTVQVRKRAGIWCGNARRGAGDQVNNQKKASLRERLFLLIILHAHSASRI